MCKIYCDQLVYRAQDVFSTYGQVHLVDGRYLTQEELRTCDILITRSTTLVNRQLLAGTPTRFVGSTTIGLDHVDVDYLTEEGIRLAYAPGCNAIAVSEYVASTLAQIGRHEGKGKNASVIGYGNVGQYVAEKLSILGYNVLVNDPPRAQAGLDCTFGYCSLEEALTADVICFHTPLIDGGKWPTRNLLNDRNAAILREHAVVLNAGRGDVINHHALMSVTHMKRLVLIMDVFAGEPQPDAEFIKMCSIVSPHIAGHSLEGKLRGTLMVANALAEYLHQPFNQTLEDYLPSPTKGARLGLADAVPLMKENQQLRQYAEEAISLGKNVIDARKFDALRSDYQMRREFAYLPLDFSGNGL